MICVADKAANFCDSSLTLLELKKNPFSPKFSMRRSTRMPGHSTRMLKPGAVSADHKTVERNHKGKRLVKRIRVIYTDPDLTDSSSDDEHETQQSKRYITSRGVKRCVKEVLMFESCKVTNQNVLNGTRLKSKYIGVRQRQNGKWTAEITDHYQHVRHWLGTYNTEEEAHSAYERKNLEIQQKREGSKDKHSAGSVTLSPSSVLEVSNTTSNGSDKISNANAGVNQDCSKKDARDEVKPADLKGKIQDMKMVFDELKQEDFLMCNLGGLADCPNSSCLLDLGMEDFSWLDEILKFCGLED
ncbi:hypothetical protein V2J09_019423 [Rumex salicifolius]